jgi:hypothetical protein
MKKIYQSKIDYSKKYNSKLSTFQIDKVLHSEVKEYCKSKNFGIREFLEKVIRESISN